VTRRILGLAGLSLLAGCGGGTSPTTPTPTPLPTPTPILSPTVLDSSNFDALVLRATKPALVEFQSPT
jgi:hypothetical protein